jgi:hypothetical protein
VIYVDLSHNGMAPEDQQSRNSLFGGGTTSIDPKLTCDG